jgi:hypothetical protein
MVTGFWSPGLSLLLGLLLPVLVSAHQVIQHELHVVVQPEHHTLQVTDRITLPEPLLASNATPQYMTLHAGLSPVPRTPGVQLVPQPVEAQTTPGESHTRMAEARRPLVRYAVILPPETRTFTLQYQGVIRHALSQQGPQDAWSMPETSGMITTDGVYLSGATYWYARFDDELVTFTLDVQLPLTWEAVSQGARTRHERRNEATHVR